MADLYTISTPVRKIIQSAWDTAFNQFGQDCRLIYSPTYIQCSNCKYDPVGNKSSNYYKHGGPVPFPNLSVCPVCNGQGRRATENSETIRICAQFDPKQWFAWSQLGSIAGGIRVADGFLQIKSFLTDVPKIKNSVEIQLLGDDAYIHYRYKLLSEPIDNWSIVQARYAIMLLQRAG